MPPTVPEPSQVVSLIRTKRAEIEAYLATIAPVRRRLVNLNLLAGGLSAFLTAGPALGGKTFAAWLTSVFGLTAPSWQLLCGLAALSSVTATVSMQWVKSHQIDEKVIKAQGLSARLEALALGVLAGTIETPRAMTDYAQVIEGAAFLRE
jgi:hypothetical protein